MITTRKSSKGREGRHKNYSCVNTQLLWTGQQAGCEATTNAMHGISESKETEAIHRGNTN